MADNENKIDFRTFEDVKKVSKILENKFLETINTYENQSNDPKYSNHFDYVVAAIYLSLKSVLPEGISFRIDYRTKSYRSMQKSTSSELLKKDTKILKKDIFGIKVIITDISGKINLDPADPQNQKIINLQNIKADNIRFINETRAWLSDSSSITKNEEIYYERIIELLDRIQNSTYPNCEDEVEIPYSIRKDNLKKTYLLKKKDENLSLSLSNEQATEIEILLSDLEKRLDDKLERELLKVFLPKALNSHLIADILQNSYKYEKDKRRKCYG